MTNESSIPNKKYNIQDRALEFAAKVAKFIDKLPKSLAGIEYSKQLIRSSASIGANIAEADGTLSKRDFVNKIALSRREARESRYWLSLIQKAGITNNPNLIVEVNWLINESRELMLILSSIINKTKLKSLLQKAPLVSP